MNNSRPLEAIRNVLAITMPLYLSGCIAVQASYNAVLANAAMTDCAKDHKAVWLETPPKKIDGLLVLQSANGTADPYKNLVISDLIYDFDPNIVSKLFGALQATRIDYYLGGSGGSDGYGPSNAVRGVYALQYRPKDSIDCKSRSTMTYNLTSDGFAFAADPKTHCLSYDYVGPLHVADYRFVLLNDYVDSSYKIKGVLRRVMELRRDDSVIARYVNYDEVGTVGEPVPICPGENYDIYDLLRDTYK